MSSQQDFLALLHRANQIANEMFSSEVGFANVTARQIHVLAAIEANEGGSQSVLTTATSIDRSTLSDIVKRLQKNKLIERRRSKSDARAYVVRLTAAGRQVLSSGKPALISVENTLLARLTKKQRANLLSWLEVVVTTGSNPTT